MQVVKSAEVETARHSAKTLGGYAWMSLAVAIWASWLVLTSTGRTTSLSIIDLAGLRAAVPAVILAPMLWHHRRTILRLGIRRCLLLSAYGAPFALFVGYGLSFAPVAHAGVMVPGLMPVLVLILAFVFLGERPSQRQAFAVSLILSGVAVVLIHGSSQISASSVWVGHLLFLAGSLCWACFSVAFRAVEIPAYLATAVVGAVSAVMLLPVWALSGLSNLASVQPTDITFQVLFQGVASGLISMFAFSRALKLVGQRASTLSALTPGVAALMAVPVLGQIPGLLDVAALCLVVTGLVIWNLGRPTASDRKATKQGAT